MVQVLKDVAVCGAISVIAAAVFLESLKLPPGLYDPLGAGELPRIVAVGIIALSVIAVAQSAFQTYWTGQSVRPAAPGDDFVRRPWLAVLIFLYAVALAVLITLHVSYWVSVSLFLLVSTLTITGLRPSAIVHAVIFALFFAVSVTYLFGSIFRVDLP